MWHDLFATEKFRIQLVNDVAGVSLCGALKSECTSASRQSATRMIESRSRLSVPCLPDIVAVAAGLIDGLEWGNNSKGSSASSLSARSTHI